jgi:AraC-like DNA-binding protein
METMQHLISQRVSEIFDLYTDLHGIRISLFSPLGVLLYPDAQGRPDCRHCRLLRETLEMDEHCRQLDRRMMKTAAERRVMVSYTCHAGMREAVVPLLVDDQLAGYVMIGQFRSCKAPDISPYAEHWHKTQGTDALQQAFAESPVFPEDKIETLLAMFRQIVELIIRSQLIHHKDYDLIEPIIDQIRQNPANPLNLKEAARMSSRSPSTVTRLFKKMTGKSFKQYQVHFRLQNAAEQITTHPNRPIAEIAIDVGFSDPLYFSRLFKKHLGQSPSAYRLSPSLTNFASTQI